LLNKRHFSLFLLLAILILFLTLFHSVAAAQITIAWNASSSATGYKVYYGTASGRYNSPGSPIDVGSVTTNTLTGLSPWQGYFIAVTAYNQYGESGYSNELNTVIGSLSLENLVTKYYGDILGRGPDPGGLVFWVSEINRIVSLGIDINEGFIALSKLFFNSTEYAALGKSNTQYITDLYQTFLDRSPNQSEINYWLGILAQGLSRDALLTDFAYCEEFELYMESIFIVSTTRPENNLVNDFYRGFLNRLPDNVGFKAWLTLMRNAQCTGAQQVKDISHQIALQFIQSGEYALRVRNNRNYIDDLYNGILQRGADPAGFANWLSLLDLGRYTREQMLQFFTDSPEFQLKVQEVINAGCLP